jgi:hypothetical protein
MLTHPTLDQLHQLGLAGMARAFEELAANPRGGELAPAEWLGLLLDREIAERQDRRLKARLRFAKLRHQGIHTAKAAGRRAQRRSPLLIEAELLEALDAAFGEPERGAVGGVVDPETAVLGFKLAG